MPNIKSAKKRVEVIKKKTMRNNRIQNSYKESRSCYRIKKYGRSKKINFFCNKENRPSLC